MGWITQKSAVFHVFSGDAGFPDPIMDLVQFVPIGQDDGEVAQPQRIIEDRSRGALEFTLIRISTVGSVLVDFSCLFKAQVTTRVIFSLPERRVHKYSKFGMACWSKVVFAGISKASPLSPVCLASTIRQPATFREKRKLPPNSTANFFSPAVDVWIVSRA